MELPAPGCSPVYHLELFVQPENGKIGKDKQHVNGGVHHTGPVLNQDQAFIKGNPLTEHPTP